MAQSDTVRIQVAEDAIEGTFLTPRSKVPGVLFIHGWGGHQDFDLNRARGIAATLAVKLCVVVALRLFVFGGDARVPVNSSVMDDRLLPVAQQDRDN